MYEEHLCFKLPEGRKKIWRYMDFTKFMDMLDKESIFFTRSDKFQDKFEGVYPKMNRELRPKNYKEELEKLPPEARENFFKSLDSIEIFAEFLKRFTLINCWHMNEYESAAMWDLYLKSNEGIAIQSSVERLVKCFKGNKEKFYIGEVEYIDYKKTIIPEGNFFYPFTFKRKSFEHERELRVVHLLELPAVDDAIDYKAPSPLEFGMPIKCDIKELIERVYVSPTAPEWVFELVCSMCQKFNLDVEVIKSELSELPY
ncbi:hypothetical protein [Bacillus thuringiensis]|uniref:hypothetical protein n=1 Tax=Bacillus thuringiensis TaxID=1428 RepID=UPI000BEE752A|nr:hypothetical protein [Bacillus thuringiensis]PDY61461.1 hypothetical protein COM87_00030 [Bacillus thuringiensis]PFD60952.1 hypothetical protein CN274_06945 [Bacillus thuringiensis]PFP79837.1 hypothetical protein COK07_09140 [Bacillus thuringiensis]PFU62043.1 hypothetical protein COK95_29540 [Bacillus thuringiensis]